MRLGEGEGEGRRGGRREGEINVVSVQALRDSCWKAKDEAAAAEKACEAKLKATHIETEKRCKSIKTETLEKAREEQQSFLQQLFPSIKVDASEPSKWMDEFEVKVEELLQGYKDQVLNVMVTMATNEKLILI